MWCMAHGFCCDQACFPVVPGFESQGQGVPAEWQKNGWPRHVWAYVAFHSLVCVCTGRIITRVRVVTHAPGAHMPTDILSKQLLAIRCALQCAMSAVCSVRQCCALLLIGGTFAHYSQVYLLASGVACIQYDPFSQFADFGQVQYEEHVRGFCRASSPEVVALVQLRAPLNWRLTLPSAQPSSSGVSRSL